MKIRLSPSIVVDASDKVLHLPKAYRIKFKTCNVYIVYLVEIYENGKRTIKMY